MGQWRRARAVVQALMPRATEPAAVSALQAADLEAQALSMHLLGEDAARKMMASIVADSQRIANAADRARSLGSVAVLVSRHVQLPPDMARTFLTLAADSLKTIGDAKVRTTATGEWMVCTGRVLANETLAHARAGRASRASATAEQLAGLLKEPVAASVQSRLQVLNYQVKLALAQPEGAMQHLSAGVATAGSITEIVERSALLRQLAEMLGGVSQEPMQAAVKVLRAQLDSKPVPGRESAYANLSWMYADLGVREIADEYQGLALATKGLTNSESSALMANLVTRGDMAAARLLHASGRYLDSEAILVRLGGYLL